MRNLKLILAAMLLLCLVLPFGGNAAVKHVPVYRQQIFPYSLSYLQKRQINNNTSKKNLNDATVRLTCAIQYNTNFIYWTLSFDGTGGSYSFDTSNYGWTPPDHSYQWWGVAPGTYTVTLHNQSWSNNYLFDANVSYYVNDQGAGEVIYDVNTDNNDIVFHNVEVTGESFLEFWVGPHP